MGSSGSNKSIASRHTVDSFLDTFTSEDNDSFEKIVEAADQKLRQKYSVLFDAEQASEQRVAQNLALPSITEQFQLEAPKSIETWTYKNQNALMYNPDGWELTQAEKIEMAKRRMEIVKTNTRLHINPFDDQKEAIGDAVKAQAKYAGNKVGLDGRELDGSDSPQVRGFSFVKTPSPAPGVSESPLMTWGEIEGTPFRLDGGDTPLHPSINSGPSFRIADTPKREQIALQLAGNVAEQQRTKKAKAIEAATRNIVASPHMRSTLDRLASLSPAAKRLTSLSTPSPRRSALNTPSVRVFKKATPSPLVRKRTPALSESSEVAPNLTDNLLILPNKRPKAADFF